MKRGLRFLYLCIHLRSIPLALWVDAYENFEPTRK